MNLDMRQLLPILLVTSLACADLADHGTAPPASAPMAPDLTWLAEREVFEPQLVFDDAGTLLLCWREKTEAGSNLYLARLGADGVFEPAVRINDEEATVESYPHDEMRAAVAVGSGGRLAAAWADRRGQVRTALSSDRGATFEASIRLDQLGEAAYRGFPALAFGASGALHAIWIDSRHAEGFAEEPADLFYAVVVDGVATESNLTADQQSTVCGCCRTYLEAGNDGSVRGLFRNADANGYRDIFMVSGREPADVSAPERVGQPLWQIEGCPMSGPIVASGRVLWPDGSTGKKLLMEAGLDGQPAQPLFSDGERGDWSPRLSPRRIESADDTELVLLPGRSTSRIVRREESNGAWTVLADDLPAWATSAVYQSGALTLVGSVSGELQHESRTAAF